MASVSSDRALVWKLRAGFLAALVAIGGSSWLTLSNARRSAETDDWVDHTAQVMTLIGTVRYSLNHTVADARARFLGEKTGAESEISDLRARDRELPGHVRHLRDLTADNPGQRKRLEGFEPQLAASLALLEGFKPGGSDASERWAATLAGVDQLRSKLDRMGLEEERLIREHVERASTAARRTSRTIPLSACVAVLVLALSSMLVRRDLELRRAVENERDLFFELCPDLLCVANTDGHFKRVSASFERILGYSRDELYARPFLEFVHPDDREATTAEVRKLSQGIPTIRFENRYLAKDGRVRWLEWEASPANGVIFATARDVTEQRELRRQVVEHQAKLAASSRMSALGLMASGVAHEINTPLGIIQMHSEKLGRLAARPPIAASEVLATSERIQATTLRIARIIRGLRAFSRDSTGDPFERARLGTLVEDALALCRERFKSREVELEARVPEPELELDCRPVQVVQVLVNLLSNAFDAVSSCPERRVSLEAGVDGDQVVLAVIDSGAGIEPALRSQLMEPFFTTKEVGQGTGLGLSISKGIAESHGGSLVLDTASTQTRFVLRFPRRREDMKEKAA
jgi:PAS domain S-box-containing protein